jgi:hypothetical protein
MKLQVIACDIDQKFPAKTYTITASDGRSITKDLCEEHAEPFEEWLEEAELGEASEAGPTEEFVAQVTKALSEHEAGERKERAAAVKKTAAKKTTARRRPKIVSLEEIEAKKG